MKKNPVYILIFLIFLTIVGAYVLLTQTGFSPILVYLGACGFLVLLISIIIIKYWAGMAWLKNIRKPEEIEVPDGIKAVKESFFKMEGKKVKIFRGDPIVGGTPNNPEKFYKAGLWVDGKLRTVIIPLTNTTVAKIRNGGFIRPRFEGEMSKEEVKKYLSKKAEGLQIPLDPEEMMRGKALLDAEHIKQDMVAKEVAEKVEEAGE